MCVCVCVCVGVLILRLDFFLQNLQLILPEGIR